MGNQHGSHSDSGVPASNSHHEPSKPESTASKGAKVDQISNASTEPAIPDAPAPPLPPPPPPVKAASAPAPVKRTAKPLIIKLPVKPGASPLPEGAQPLRIVILSDTHNHVDGIPLPEGDILIHCGDFTVYGSDKEVKEFRSWLAQAPFKHKVVVNGNHEVWPDSTKKKLVKVCHFLDDCLVEVAGLKIFGTKWKTDYKSIPEGLDILVTHRPPTGFGDVIWSGQSVGSAHLTKEVERARPILHVFGHNHEGYGATWNEHTTFINAANCIGGSKAVMRRQAILVHYYPDYRDDYTGVGAVTEEHLNQIVHDIDASDNDFETPSGSGSSSSL